MIISKANNRAFVTHVPEKLQITKYKSLLQYVSSNSWKAGE